MVHAQLLHVVFSLCSKPGCHRHHLLGVLRPLHCHPLPSPWMDLWQLHVQNCCLSTAGKKKIIIIIEFVFSCFLIHRDVRILRNKRFHTCSKIQYICCRVMTLRALTQSNASSHDQPDVLWYHTSALCHRRISYVRNLLLTAWKDLLLLSQWKGSGHSAEGWFNKNIQSTKIICAENREKDKKSQTSIESWLETMRLYEVQLHIRLIQAHWTV